ncbi:MAG: CoA transferase [Bacteroidales bacterium]|nr:CoA transferase [Bacteroidales bacterium]
MTSTAITPHLYARLLLDSLGLGHLLPTVADQRPADLLWAMSGAMWLSGHHNGEPRTCPAPLAACAQGAWLALATLCPWLDPHFEACRLLGERAAIAGLTRRGRVSAGGACRLLDTADGGLALNLAREDDSDLLPAWLEREAVAVDELDAILKTRPTRPLLERARLLGLAAAPLVPPRPRRNWYQARRHGRKMESGRERPLVVDLSSLWAGPLCAQLLVQCGARVIKVESIQRPDGARVGPPAFYDLMSSGKESVALELRQPEGLAQLRALLERADIVIESARPRALEQMGIRAADIVGAGSGKVWLGITGYGRRAPLREWIAYGDDAGVAAGLSWLMGGNRGDPVFCGDAIADPLTGLHGALLALAAWNSGGGQLLDLSLYGVVAHCIGAGPVARGPMAHHQAEKPLARPPAPAAAELGADTARILGELL